MTGTVNFNIDLSPILKSITPIEKNIAKYNESALKDAQIILRNKIKKLAPKKSGKYAESWKLGKITGNRAEVFTNNKYKSFSSNQFTR